jgi:hypothetical protein
MNSFYGGGGDNMMQGGGAGGERVRVAMRVRPMMPHEGNRGDENIITIPDTSHVLLSLKAGTKSFRFNAVLDESIKQSEVFNLCGVHVINHIVSFDYCRNC